MSSPDAPLSTRAEARGANAGDVLRLPRYVVEKGGRVEYCNEVLCFTALGEGIFTYDGDRYRLVGLPVSKVRCCAAYDFRLREEVST